MNRHIPVQARTQVLALAFAVLATTALGAHAGTTQTDPVTGQVWQIFDHVSDGVAQGYRRATVDDFKQLLVDSNWLARTGSPSVYEFKGGGTTFINGVYTTNQPNIDFGQKRLAAVQETVSPAFYATAAWLQDSNDTNAVGIVEIKLHGGSICSGGASCNQFYQYNSATEIATAADLVNKFGPGKFPSHIEDGYRPIYFDPLSSYRQLDSTIQAGTFMITSVPEPASAALLSLGLMGVVASACARRSQQAHRQG